MPATTNNSSTADAHRLFTGREVFAGLRDLLLLVGLVAWWVLMSELELKKYRPIGLLLLPYVLMRWRWCTTAYGTRVFGAASTAPTDAGPAPTAPDAPGAPADAAPADTAPPPTPHRAQSLPPPAIDIGLPAPAPAQVLPEVQAQLKRMEALQDRMDRMEALLDRMEALLTSQGGEGR
ncbi:hypothetical protein B9479_007727 [Cryptococcus floricola]|uniref:Uncharacterized protein n=1 Tax=Cryptococcus floricola TaxID=2591691 RepID=A0A5D3AL62_9TREE|nr:hypothetical protein B9479_007727 [Cryptococcus floricola]